MGLCKTNSQQILNVTRRRRMLDRCRIVAVGGHEYRAPNFCGKARWQNTKLCETRMAHLFQKKAPKSPCHFLLWRTPFLSNQHGNNTSKCVQLSLDIFWEQLEMNWCSKYFVPFSAFSSKILLLVWANFSYIFFKPPFLQLILLQLLFWIISLEQVR